MTEQLLAEPSGRRLLGQAQGLLGPGVVAGTEPGHGELGQPVTLEVDGFDQDGTLSVWLGDSPAPIAKLDYTEMPCDWPWVGELTLPEQLSGAGAGDETPEASPIPGQPVDEGGLQMLQVVLEGTGLTADCPIIIGEPPEAAWFTEDTDEPAGTDEA